MDTKDFVELLKDIENNSPNDFFQIMGYMKGFRDGLTRKKLNKEKEAKEKN
ncbi:hypothetical protein UMC2_37691 [[Clostridium] sordellii]|uniref:hypothetical protein n=1 Tax=Paraclostridium sordellii TaxID=1505 RepID=UPI0005442B74|nr:hypothetical protein [Paeniclostridium sordellii]CEK34558.1 hypothetical protein UMC2_37691 [[Clostridium] sordellii] [Paeniclostridium sordellii]